MPTLFRFLVATMVLSLVFAIVLSVFKERPDKGDSRGFFSVPICPQGEVAVRNYNNMDTVCVLRGKGG